MMTFERASDPDLGERTHGDDVDAVFDALHGNIDLTDFVEAEGCQIRNIITAPFMQRLRRVKQLGFVSQNFLSAQHNRYSHALGTMHIMRKLIEHLDSLGSLEQFLPALAFIEENSRGDKLAWLKQHLLVAALIQDIGELPYEKATAGIFLPSQTILETVESAGIKVAGLKKKDVFTLFFVWDDYYYDQYFRGLSKPFLTFLIAGRMVDGEAVNEDLLALRQLVDGTIDADRLDYVYRDAFHSIGVHHTPDALIQSIVKYDAKGPILSHVRPVTDFMITRAMLWSNVYLSPENRFRIVLLRIALSELRNNSKAVEDLFNGKPNELKETKFLLVDDLYIDHLVRSSKEAGLNLSLQSARALELLENGAADYEYRWVRFGESVHPEWEKRLTLPRGFYYDTYADYREKEHTLYTQKAVRVVGERYSLLGRTGHTYLEDCIGPFCDLLRSARWRALPMPDHMAWFVPRSASKDPDQSWRTLLKFKESLQLATQLKINDPLMGRPFKFDTRTEGDFHAPDILILCADEDREAAHVLASILFDLRRHYFVLLDPAKNVGRTSVRVRVCPERSCRIA